MIGETTFPMQKNLNYLGNNTGHEHRHASYIQGILGINVKTKILHQK